jgi:transposase
LERRRKRAVDAVAAGESVLAVANAVGVHIKSVERWVRMARQPKGLDAKPQPGPAPGLTDAQLERLERLLLKGAKAHG